MTLRFVSWITSTEKNWFSTIKAKQLWALRWFSRTKPKNTLSLIPWSDIFKSKPLSKFGSSSQPTKIFQFISANTWYNQISTLSLFIWLSKSKSFQFTSMSNSKLQVKRSLSSLHSSTLEQSLKDFLQNWKLLLKMKVNCLKKSCSILWKNKSLCKMISLFSKSSPKKRQKHS